MVQYLSQRTAFAALSDTTRRGILEQLGHRAASVTELAGHFGMTLTGIKKHIQLLEDAGLVVSEKAGRVRICRLGPNHLEVETTWIENYRRTLEERYDHLEAFLERTKGEEQ